MGVRLNILIVDVLFPLRSLEEFTLRKHMMQNKNKNNGVDEAVLIFFDNFSLHF